MFIPQKDFFRFIKKCWYSYLGTHPLIKKSLGIFKFSGLDSVLEVRFKNELVRFLVHLTKKWTFRSLLVLWEKVN